VRRPPDAIRDAFQHDCSMASLDGQTVVITGASRGLGRALALAAARRGASLSLCARGAVALEEVAAACRWEGVEVLAIAADVGDARDVERFAALTLQRFNVVDVLVNNASVLGPTPLPYLADAPVAAFDSVLQANLVGPLRLTQALIGGMLLRDRGLVINISSDAAVTGYPGWSLYASSKAALDALTRGWAAELDGTGVRVISVDPGDMDTDMHRAADPDADPEELAQPDDVAKQMIRLLEAALPDADRITAAALQ
jgi:NAD(P)-dependent dehydrogenase (short-subunit alcohol dehydrogenase family)